MRVTTDMQFRGILRNVQQTQTNLAKLQDQLASGVRLQRPVWSKNSAALEVLW